MEETELKNFLGKTVRIVCMDGEVLEGFISYYEDSYDNDPDEACLTIKKEKRLGREVEVGINEIKSIETID